MTNVVILIIFGIILVAVGIIWFRTDSISPREKLGLYSGLSALLVLHIIVSMLLPLRESNLDTLLIFFGVLTFVLGALFAVWAKIVMGENWGAPGQHDPDRQRMLVTYGPFLISRNPIYVGVLLMFLGASLALQSYSILLIPFVLYYMYTIIKKEEQLLGEYFGEEYDEYKTEVPRFLII